ncbi:putative P450 monooxygenase [Karstenula rhodostoma CBS 690.94]|uniref:P450 monooxygenase n=1 Tax=Karstenula rhodostoma CBS 690.94 TaxID=1392251 RepID=A0A9P4UAJ6_9PLEO|nr:putative P450 monooxygenase [Karstenula rhodostoma CBS 690.94]
MPQPVSTFLAALALLPVTAIFLACISVKLWFFTTLLIKWKFPLTRVPGPTFARWSRFWLVKALFAGRFADELVDLHKKYGPIVRIGPRHVIISDADSIRRILAVDSSYTRGPWFDSLRLHMTRANVISERDPRRHSHMRSILGPGLSGHSIFDMESTIDEHVKGWIAMLQGTARSGSVDLSTSLPLLTVDLISHLCLGKSFDCSKSKTDRYGFIRAMRSGMIIQQYTSLFPELQSVLAWLGKLRLFRPLVYPTHKDNFGVGPAMQLIHGALQKKINASHNGDTKADMMTSFIARGLPTDQVESEMIIILAGGTDTTSTAAQGVIFSILSDKTIYKRLRAEIDDFCYINKRSLKYPIQDAVARKMPYLQACIYEGLRRYPPLFQLRERVVSPMGDCIHGYEIPPGTFVGINGLATQLDTIYGHDPEVFRPERWLTKHTAHLKNMHRTLELVFGYGSSRCLGVKMAYTELNKIIFELFAHFDLSFLDPLQPWKRSARGIFIQSDFKVEIKLRCRVNRQASR